MPESDDQRSVNTRALEVATQALSRIEQHEAACVMERREIMKALDRIHNRIDALGSRWFAVSGGVILLLLSIVGFLLVSGQPWIQ